MKKFKRGTLKNKVESVKSETTSALQTMYDALNQGQKKKMLKNVEVKELLDRYGVVYEITE